MSHVQQQQHTGEVHPFRVTPIKATHKKLDLFDYLTTSFYNKNNSLDAHDRLANEMTRIQL